MKNLPELLKLPKTTLAHCFQKRLIQSAAGNPLSHFPNSGRQTWWLLQLGVLQLGVLLYLPAGAQTCGSLTSPGQASNFTTTSISGSSMTWSNPGYAQSTDTKYASSSYSFSVAGTAYSDYLVATGFSFSVPNTATICGISVQVVRNSSGLSILGSHIQDNSVRLLKNGVFTGDDSASSATWPNGSDGTATYGRTGVISNWNSSWLPVDVNTGLGVAISAKMTAGLLGLISANINSIIITVTYDMNSTLATVISTYTVNNYPGGVQLSWAANSPNTGSSFTVQRAPDAKTWQNLATMQAMAAVDTEAGSQQTYVYTDNSPLPGQNYYRLRMSTSDGHQIWTAVKEIQVDGSIQRCYPCPFTGLINIASPTPVHKIVLKDIQGRILQIQTFSDGIYHAQLTAGDLPPGIYILQADGNTYRLVKNEK